MSEAKRRAALWRAARQEQFLNVVSRDEAEARFRSHLKLEPLGVELVSLALALGRVLAGDVSANVDVPGFDRASIKGQRKKTGSFSSNQAQIFPDAAMGLVAGGFGQ